MQRLLVAATLGGCSLVVDLDGLKSAGSPDASIDASDAAVTIDASDASTLPDVGTYHDEVTSDFPSSWWRLGETSALMLAKDENGNFAPGQYREAGVTFGVKGALASDGNTAITLDGNNGAVVMPGTDYILDGLPAFTLEIWASPAVATGSTQRLVSHRTSSNADGWVLLLDSSLVPTYQELAAGAALANLTASKGLTVGTYSHIVVTGDGSTLTMYVNGQPSGVAVKQQSVPITAAPGLVLGSSSGVAQEFFKGSIDEAAIYIKCLGPDRVLAHYLAALK
jgi:hypothetical protein